MLTLGTQGLSDFTQPIEMMMDCHRRIEKFLMVLWQVIESAGGGPLDTEHREALDTVLKYFRQGAPRHTEDEEKSLFPRLRDLHDAHADEVLNHIQSLEADHRMAEAAHARIDELGVRWLDGDGLDSSDIDALEATTTQLRDTYLAHILQEDTQLFPLAKQLLNDEQLQAIGREMQQRRAVDPGRPGSRCASRRLALQQELSAHAE
ncbi:MAG: hemerythrin domain-containing protein [Phycisphaerales bacterium]